MRQISITKATLLTAAATVLGLSTAGCRSTPPDEFLDSQLYIVNDAGVRNWEATGVSVRKFCTVLIDGCSFEDDRDKTTKVGAQNYLMTGQVSRSKKPFILRLVTLDAPKQVGVSELSADGEMMPWGVLYSAIWDLVESARQIK